MAELKSCPFCGGEARISRESDEDCIGNFHFVECCSCRARSRVHFAGYGNDCPVFYAGIREDWNRRTSIGDTPAPQSTDVSPLVSGDSEANKEKG